LRIPGKQENETTHNIAKETQIFHPKRKKATFTNTSMDVIYTYVTPIKSSLSIKIQFGRTSEMSD
jgi:hypothetical protein